MPSGALFNVRDRMRQRRWSRIGTSPFVCKARPHPVVLARRLGWDIELTERGEYHVSIGGITVLLDPDMDRVATYLGHTVMQRVATGRALVGEITTVAA